MKMKRALLVTFAAFYSSILAASATGRVEPNISSEAVNDLLRRESACRFFGSQSHSVKGGLVTPDERVKIVKTSKDLLSKCREIARTVGTGTCFPLELAGHALRQSLSLEKIFGMDVRPGRVAVYPADSNAYAEVVSCLRSLAGEGAPLIFSTCGGARRPDGTVFQYPGKREAHASLSNSTQMTVISSLGPCSADGAGALSPAGWYQSVPELPDSPE